MLLARELAARPAVGGVTVATPTPRGTFDDASLPFRVVRQPRPVTLWRLIGDADAVLLAGPCFAPLAMALLRRKPVAVEHHGYQAACPNGLLFEEPRKAVCPGHFMRRRYVRCIRCVGASEGWGRAIANVVATFPRRWMCARVGVNIAITAHVGRRLRLPRTRVIYYGIPLGAAGGDGRGVDPPLLVYVGRLVSEKGIPLLLEAARALRDEGWRFLVRIVGDGPERDRLERIAADRNLTGGSRGRSRVEVPSRGRAGVGGVSAAGPARPGAGPAGWRGSPGESGAHVRRQPDGRRAPRGAEGACRLPPSRGTVALARGRQ